VSLFSPRNSGNPSPSPESSISRVHTLWVQASQQTLSVLPNRRSFPRSWTSSFSRGSSWNLNDILSLVQYVFLLSHQLTGTGLLDLTHLVPRFTGRSCGKSGKSTTTSCPSLQGRDRSRDPLLDVGRVAEICIVVGYVSDTYTRTFLCPRELA
jgi:hypothetical protein